MSDLPLFNSEKAENFSSEEVLEQLKSSLAGLSEREARERLSRFGPNAIEDKQIHPLVKMLPYFWGPIPWMIEAAAISGTCAVLDIGNHSGDGDLARRVWRADESDRLETGGPDLGLCSRLVYFQ